MSQTQDSRKSKAGLTIRYMGTDSHRQFLIERGDGRFWSGTKWVSNLSKAKLFNDHKTTQLACKTLQYSMYKGKSLRKFRIDLDISLVGDLQIDPEALKRFLAQAVRIDVENAVFGDGPVEGSFVQAKMKLTTLRETPTSKKVF